MNGEKDFKGKKDLTNRNPGEERRCVSLPESRSSIIPESCLWPDSGDVELLAPFQPVFGSVVFCPFAKFPVIYKRGGRSFFIKSSSMKQLSEKPGRAPSVLGRHSQRRDAHGHVEVL
jgi:hypothetical protein